MRRAVVFGAGSIGRGFIGASLSLAGWHVTFVDVVAALVERLAADGCYRQVVVSNAGEESIQVGPVAALLLADEAVPRELARADLVATAVGAANLGPVAQLLARESRRRLAVGGAPLDVLLGENLHDAPAVMRALLADAGGEQAAEAVGLAATSIGRMVPVPVPDAADPTLVRVEPYRFLPYDAAALHRRLEVPDLIAVEDGFAFFEDRKLYVHNMGHCLLAYLGELKGYQYTWEAVADPQLRGIVQGAMVESATAVAARFNRPVGPVLAHVGDLLTRFGNRALADTIERVGRDPLRKMGPQDRLLGAYRACLDAGVEPVQVSVGVALGARRLAAEDCWDLDRAVAHVASQLFPDGQSRLATLFRTLLSASQVDDIAEALDAYWLPSRTL